MAVYMKGKQDHKRASREKNETVFLTLRCESHDQLGSRPHGKAHFALAITSTSLVTHQQQSQERNFSGYSLATSACNMIEISAKVCRGSVYFTGELVKCFITFRNVPIAREDNKPSDSTETLAWAGVQIYCHCTLDEARVQFLPDSSTGEQGSMASPDTSFNPSRSERGHVVFSTNPRILFCDLKLAPNESKTFVYQEYIPEHAPPSYYGTSVKYLYKLTIGTQRVNAVIQLLRMPLRVLSIKNQIELNNSKEQENGTPNGTSAEQEVLDIILHKLDCLTSRRYPSSFAITNQSGHVVRFCLLKSTFKLGEDVVGVFNFADANVPCVQFSVSLQSEEIISDECKANPSKTAVCVTNYSKYHEFCLHTSNTQMILPIPLTITPAFSTNLMTLTWKLHFEFVTTNSEDVDNIDIPDSQGVMYKSPSDMKVQTMGWDLPLNILPTHPIQVSRGLQIPASGSLMV